MSKHNNVNPDHYKAAGRERQGENVIHEVERREAKRVRQGQSLPRPQHVGISNRMSPNEEGRAAAEHPPLETDAPPPSDRRLLGPPPMGSFARTCRFARCGTARAGGTPTSRRLRLT
jgi:hypothetical protein